MRAHLVEDVGVGLQRQEAMGAARRNEQGGAVVAAEFRADPASVAGGAVADIDDHIKQATGGAAHQLRLRIGRRMKMHST